MLKPST